VKEHDPHAEADSMTLFGFWVYLMTDCLLFGTLFATYAVLHNSTHGGATARELFSMPFVLVETLILLTSSFTCGLATLAASQNQKKELFFWFAITFLLGAAFLGMELHEFSDLIKEGHSWRSSAFLSAFFTLVATHGAHITIGLIWMIVLLVPVMRHGVTSLSLRRLSCLGIFWHFLDVVWIFIFTIVYLMGVS